MPSVEVETRQNGETVAGLKASVRNIKQNKYNTWVLVSKMKYIVLSLCIEILSHLIEPTTTTTSTTTPTTTTTLPTKGAIPTFASVPDYIDYDNGVNG